MINSNLIKNVEFLNKHNSKQNLKLGSFADMNQTHSDIVLEIDKKGTYEADALITEIKNLKLVVKTADCMPVVISDGKKVGVIHIGWKGVENKIFFKTIKKFNLSNLKVSIGPHAQKCCYEIKDDLFKKFPESTIQRQSKKYLDLSKEIVRFCIEKKIDFENSSICTIDSDSFNSYRRDRTNLRQWSIVWI